MNDQPMNQRTRTIFKSLAALFLLFAQSSNAQAEKAKIVFISGEPSHGPMAHEHRAGNMILAKALNESGLGVDAAVLPDVGYPVDASVLDDAATIVVFCTGHQEHLLNPKLAEFDTLMKKGTGVVMIHWATEAKLGQPAKMFLQWMGGYCALDWSVNPHWTPEFKTFPDHPVANGLTPFSLNDEWYYHMRFVSELEGVIPILSAVPGTETLKRPDGPRSGNPTVRKAVANGESQHVAWAYERPEGGGRGFGFTGAHNHLSWQNDNFRKVVLNAILWTAQVEVPEDGVPSKTPSDEEMRKNLDDKGNKKEEEKETPRILELDEVREQQVQKMDTSASLALLVTALAKTENPNTRSALLNGILKGLEGQREVTPPAEWEAVSATLSQSPNDEVKSLTEQLSQVFGDEEAAQNALDTLANKDSELDDRRRSLASLLVQQHEELLPILGELLDEKELRIEAIRGYSVFESKAAPDILLERYPEFGPDARRAILETLATRESYATALFDALESKTVSAADLPAYVARSLSHLLGETFTEKYGMKKLSKDKEAIIAQYRELATPATLADADASKGRLVFQQVCMACHKMYGEGGIIGPDITGSNRADLNYLLLNTIDPSGDIPDAYQMVMITTKSGQLLAGTVTGEDDQKVVLNMIGQQTVVAKSDIQSRETAPVSMMPEGLLQTLEKQQVLNLFKYLQTKEQVDLPK